MVTSYSGKSDEKQVSTTVCEELLGIKPEEFLKLDDDKRYQTVCSALERRCKNEYVKEECEKRVLEKRVLIVLDNVVDLKLFQNDQLSGLFEHGIPKNLDIIATSRKRPENIPLFNANPEEKSLAVAYHLGNLDEESALELFRKHCVFADFNTNPPDNVENNPKNEQIRTETEAAREIIRLLDCHAWSICHIAGAFSECYKHLEPPDEEDGDPLEFGNKTCEQLLQELQVYFSEELTEKGHLQSVNIEEYADKVMRLTVEQISQLEAGKDILSCAAMITLFAPDFVPLRLQEAFWKYLHAEDSSVNWTVVKDTLLRHHILSGPKSKISRMHRLTWKYFRTYAAEYDVNLDESAKNFAAYIQDFVLTNALFQKEAAALIHLGEFWCRALHWHNFI